MNSFLNTFLSCFLLRIVKVLTPAVQQLTNVTVRLTMFLTRRYQDAGTLEVPNNRKSIADLFFLNVNNFSIGLTHMK